MLQLFFLIGGWSIKKSKSSAIVVQGICLPDGFLVHSYPADFIRSSLAKTTDMMVFASLLLLLLLCWFHETFDTWIDYVLMLPFSRKTFCYHDRYSPAFSSFLISLTVFFILSGPTDMFMCVRAHVCMYIYVKPSSAYYVRQAVFLFLNLAHFT